MQPAIGTVVMMGWEDVEDGDNNKTCLFIAKIAFDKPPEWPLKIVWEAVPVTITPNE